MIFEDEVGHDGPQIDRRVDWMLIPPPPLTEGLYGRCVQEATPFNFVPNKQSAAAVA